MLSKNLIPYIVPFVFLSTNRLIVLLCIYLFFVLKYNYVYQMLYVYILGIVKKKVSLRASFNICM